VGKAAPEKRKRNKTYSLYKTLAFSIKTAATLHSHSRRGKKKENDGKVISPEKRKRKNTIRYEKRKKGSCVAGGKLTRSWRASFRSKGD